MAPEAATRAWPIGKTWSDGAHFADPTSAALYARCTSDTSPAYTGRDPLVPPSFHVRLIHGMLFRIAADPELGLDLLRLLHGEHDATFHRPIRVWDLVHVRGRLESVEEKASGVVVTSRIFGFVEGALAVEARTVYFVRAPARADAAGPAAPRAPAAPEPDPGPPDFTERVALAADLSHQYAIASKDDNPIHLDPEVARRAGHPDVILQGLCSLAITGAAAMRAVGGNDARRVRRIAGRFMRPVNNGGELEVRGWRIAPGVHRLETRDGAGQVVIGNGRLELSDR